MMNASGNRESAAPAPEPFKDRPRFARDIESLIQDLKNSEWRLRKTAAASLAKLGEAAVGHLSKTLYSDNPDVSYWSTLVLARIGGPGINPLIRVLTDGDKDMRAFAAKALSETRDKRVIPPLINALGDSSWKVRKNAAESLQAMGPMIVKPVVQALRNENEDVRYWATRILGEMGEDGVEPLIILLSKGNKDMRFFAAEALGDTDNPRAVEKLIDALGDKSWSVRKSTATSLRKIGEIAIQPLARALEHPNPDVRHWSAKILGKIGNQAITALIRQLKDTDNEMRTLTRNVIDAMGESAVEPLISILEKGDKEMRKNAAEALGNTRSEKAIKPLIKALADESWFVRKNAAEAIEDMGRPAIKYLTEALEADNEDVMFWAVRILGQIGIEDISPIVRVMNSSNRDSRYFAVEALGKSNTPEAAKHLIAALRDDCWPIRRKAAENLARMKTISLPLIIRSLREEHPDVKYWSKRVLKAIGPSALDSLHDMLMSGDTDSKIYATFALGELADPRSITFLVRGLTDDNEWVRRYSASAISEIKHPDAVRHLMSCLETEDEDMCMWVGKALSNLGEVAVPDLINGLTSKNTRVERYCATALSELGNPKAMEPLVKLYMTGDEGQGYWLYKEIKKLGVPAVNIIVKYIMSGGQEQLKRACDLVLEMDDESKKKFCELRETLPQSKELNQWISRITRGLNKKVDRKG